MAEMHYNNTYSSKWEEGAKMTNGNKCPFPSLFISSFFHKVIPQAQKWDKTI